MPDSVVIQGQSQPLHCYELIKGKSAKTLPQHSYCLTLFTCVVFTPLNVRKKFWCSLVSSTCISSLTDRNWYEVVFVISKYLWSGFPYQLWSPTPHTWCMQDKHYSHLCRALNIFQLVKLHLERMSLGMCSLQDLLSVQSDQNIFSAYEASTNLWLV